MKRFRKSVIGLLAALLLMSFVVPGATAVEPMADAAVESDVKVGNDLDLSAKKNITIKASEENFTSSNSSSQMGIGLSADLSKGKIADLSISKVHKRIFECIGRI